MNSPFWSGSTISGGVIFSLKPRMRLRPLIFFCWPEIRAGSGEVPAPKNTEHTPTLRRARTVRNPILAEEFEKLAHSWLRLAKAAERDDMIVQPQFKKRDEFRA
jgi:hypothetical protein